MDGSNCLRRCDGTFHYFLVVVGTFSFGTLTNNKVWSVDLKTWLSALGEERF